MKKRSYVVMFVFLFTLLTFATSPQTVEAQTSPSIRYVSMENTTGSEHIFIWAVFDVSEWADKIYFRVWMIRNGEQSPAGNWAIGLSERLDQGSAQIMPGFGIQGIYGGDFVGIHQVTAEAPFAKEVRIHPIDGEQTYYFYKTRITFNFTLQDDDVLVVGADYKNDPEYYDGALPYYGPYNTGDYYTVVYANIPDEGQVPPEDDTPLPQVTAEFTVSPSTAYVDSEITFDGSASSSENSNIASYSWNFGDGNVNVTNTPTTIHPYVTSGNYTVTLTVTDEFGRTNSTSKNVVVLQEEDYEPPVTTDNYDGFWHTSDITITLTASDQVRGVAETYYKINEGEQRTVSSNGNPVITTEGKSNTLEYWSVDNAGNEENHNMLTGIKLDKTAPVSAMNLSGSTGSGGWFTSDVTLIMSAVDALSGVNKIEYSFDNQAWNTYSAQATLADEGDHIIYYRAVDDAGNVEQTKTEEYKLDKTAPVGYVVVNENATYVDSLSVTLTLSADDPVSGVSQMRFSNDGNTWTSWESYSTSKGWQLSSGSGTKTVFVQFKNNADLISNKYRDTIIFDTTEPTADAGSDHTVTVNEPTTFSGKKSSDNTGIVSYTWNFGDGTSGSGETVTYQYSQTGKYTVTLTVQDIAGNIDETKITVNVVLPAEETLFQIGLAAAATTIVAVLVAVIWKKRKNLSNISKMFGFKI